MAGSLFTFCTTNYEGHGWSALIRVMLARLLLMLATLIVLLVTGAERNDNWQVYIFLAVAFAVTILYALWIKNEESVQVSAIYQFTVDIIVVTGMVHFTGGWRSELIILYPLVILAAAVVVSGRMALKMAVLAVFLYGTLVVLEMQGVLPVPSRLISGEKAPVINVLRVLMLQVLVFVVFAGASSHLSDKCLEQGRQLERVNLIVGSILANVQVPILGVDANGTVLYANSQAEKLLGTNKDALVGEDFTAFLPVASATVPELITAARDQIYQVQRADGQMVPITLDVRRNTGSFFAAGASGGLHYLITLIDVSEMFRIKDKVTNDADPERDENMVGLVTEMAHQVRNPLTTIRGAGELISSAVEATLAEKGQLTPDDWETLRTMCQLISEQTQELDSKVSRLMHLAVDEPDKLETLLDESDHWRQKVASAQGKSAKNMPVHPSSPEDCSD